MSNFKEVADMIAEQKNIKAISTLGFGGRSGGSKWDYGLSTYQDVLTLDHFTLRQNARSAYHDSSAAAAMISRMADSVAGTGIMLEPSPKNDILGLTLEEAERWADDVANRFDSFAQNKKQCRSEVMNLYQACRYSEILAQRDGENFARFFYSNDRDLISPVQFEFIDPNQIRGNAYTSTLGPSIQNDGITRDSRGRETHYKIWVKNDKTQQYEDKTIPAKGSKSKRIFMIHRFAPEYPGQQRGFPRLANALQEFENITDFTSAQIKKAINQSNIVFYTKPNETDPASNPFQDMLSSGTAGPSISNLPPVPSSDPEAAFNPGLDYTPLREATLKTPGSTGVFSLQGGEDLKPFENTAPADGFGTFVNDFTSYLAAANSMPIEVLLMKFNSNYSASRAALLMFWNVALIWRQEQTTDFLSPIYEMWLSEEIARGTIKAPGWSNPVLKAAWLNARWIGPSMPNIDPLKTAFADKEYIEMGATTQDRVAREYNGSVGKTNRAVNARTYPETATPPWKITQTSSEEEK